MTSPERTSLFDEDSPERSFRIYTSFDSRSVSEETRDRLGP